MFLRPRLLVIFVFALALTAIGCGDSDSSDTAAAPPMTKAAFVKEANALCNKSRAIAIERAFALSAQRPDESKRAQEVELFRTVMLPDAQKRIDRVLALGVPSGDEDQVEAIFSKVEEILDRAESDPESFFQAQINYKYPLKEAEKLADRYGLSDCVQP